MSDTTVTTAARRITRVINATKPGWLLWFDLDGRLVERIYDPEHRCCGPLPDDAWIPWSRQAGQHATEREVQAELTAITDALTVEQHPGSARSLARQLVELRCLDGPEPPRLSLAEELAVLEAIGRDSDAHFDNLVERRLDTIINEAR